MTRGNFFKGVVQWDFFHQEMERSFLLKISDKPIFFQYMHLMEAILCGPRNLMDD